jgi:hypothetical protein
MSRWLTVVACGLVWLLPGTVQAQPDKNIPAKLMSPIDFKGIDDPKTSLAEALTSFQDRFDLAFRVNERAFKTEQLMEVLRTEIANPNPILALPGGRFKDVLQAVLARVPVESGATFLVRDGYIEITTNLAARSEIWGDSFRGPFLPLIHLRGQDRLLVEYFHDVAQQGPLNVVIDPRLKDQLSGKVTIQLVNVPADTALNLLSEMGSVQTVRLRNVYYITTADRAVELRKSLP